MAKKTITARAVPALRLSERDTTDLRELGRQLKTEVLSQYEDYVIRSKRQLDCLRWRFDRAERNLHAYTERFILGDKTKDQYACTTKPSVDSHPQATMARASRQRRVLVTGTLVGSLQDAMHGATFQDSQSLQALQASRPTPMDESAVVATVEQGSESDPFRFVGVTWSLRAASVRVKRKHAHDFLTLVESGLTRLSSGEQVGVVLGHSVQHRGFAEMREFDTIRSKVSMLTVYRQLDAQRIEVWSLQVGDATPRPAWGFHGRDSHAQQRLLDCACVCYAGLHRKLRWLLQKRRRVSTETWAAIEPTSSGCSDACGLCLCPPTTLFTRSRPCCQLCFKQVCLRCSVSLSLVVSQTRVKPSPERVTICMECMVRAKSVPAKQVAQEELLATTGILSPK